MMPLLVMGEIVVIVSAMVDNVWFGKYAEERRRRRREQVNWSSLRCRRRALIALSRNVGHAMSWFPRVCAAEMSRIKTWKVALVT